MTIKDFRRALIKYFSIYERPDRLIIECDHCGARWSQTIRRGKELGAGNVLHLLNHAYGHHEEREA